MSDLKFPVKDLQNRYGLGRTALYARFNAANIEPEKEGTRSYISGEELEELDRLDSHIKTGGKLEEFKPVLQSQSAIVPAASSLSQSDNFADTLTLIESIARQIAATRDPLQHYTSLERACASGWLLSTSEVRSLVGTKPTGDRWQRGSFVFIRSGKIGAQAAWRVVKVEGNSYKVF